MSVRQLRLPTLAVLLGSLLASWATAAVFERDLVTGSGDGLLTFDDVSNREWLDLTETQLFNFPGDTLEEQYQAVVAQTNPGGIFDDFTVAKEADVFALAESAGIDTSTTNFDTNQAAADSLISLLGDPILAETTPNKRAVGFLNDDRLSTWLSVVFVPAPRTTLTAGVTHSLSFRGDRSGIWLYRQVPEPSTGVLLIAVLPLLLRRARSQELFQL